jgi:hypothetical protein
LPAGRRSRWVSVFCTVLMNTLSVPAAAATDLVLK